MAYFYEFVIIASLLWTPTMRLLFRFINTLGFFKPKKFSGARGEEGNDLMWSSTFLEQ